MSKFSSLVNQYNNFLTPDYSIIIDGKDLKKSLNISNLSVDLSIGEECNACRFSVSRFYEAGSQSLDSNVQSLLVPGKIIKISLGYGSKLIPVFNGFLANISFGFMNDLYMQVHCLDARALMRKNKKIATYENMDEKQLIEKMLNNYSALVKSRQIEMDDLSKPNNITVNTDDLSYILSETRKRGLLFYMDGDKICITKSAGDVCVEFTWGDFEIRHNINFMDMSFVGIGYDIDNMENITAKAEAKQKGKQSDCVKTEMMLEVEPYLTKELAQKFIDAAAKNEERTAQTGLVECAGLPEIKPGQKVKFNKFPFLPYTKKDEFLVNSVSHDLSENGFRTSFNIFLEV